MTKQTKFSTFVVKNDARSFNVINVFKKMFTKGLFPNFTIEKYSNEKQLIFDSFNGCCFEEIFEYLYRFGEIDKEDLKNKFITLYMNILLQLYENCISVDCIGLNVLYIDYTEKKFYFDPSFSFSFTEDKIYHRDIEYKLFEIEQSIDALIKTFSDSQKEESFFDKEVCNYFLESIKNIEKFDSEKYEDVVFESYNDSQFLTNNFDEIVDLNPDNFSTGSLHILKFILSLLNDNTIEPICDETHSMNCVSPFCEKSIYNGLCFSKYTKMLLGKKFKLDISEEALKYINGTESEYDSDFDENDKNYILKRSKEIILNEEEEIESKKYGNFIDSSLPEITEEVIN